MTAAALLMLVMSSPVFAQPQGGPVVVIAVHGDVQVTSNGAARVVKPGSTIGTPATIRTGHDGFIEVRQGATTAAIAADTRVDLPAVTAADGLIEHIAQPAGNVLYDVAKRPGRKLRIETPYLVAVVKGTRFNVAAQERTATISLLEGQLEIWTPDESDFVQLNAGEIATRGGDDPSIRVLGMATGEAIRAHSNPRGADVASPPATTPALRPDAAAAISAGTTGGTGAVSDAASTDTAPVAAATDASAETDTRIDLDTKTIDAIDVGLVATTEVAPAEAQLDLGVDAGTESMPVAVDTSIDLSTTTGATADVTAGSADLDLDVPLDTDTRTPALDVSLGTTPVVVDDITEPLPTVVQDAVAPVQPVVEEVVAPVTDVVEQIVEPAPAVIEDVAAPVTDVLEEVVAPVSTVTDEVTAPLAVTEQLVAPLLRGRLGP